MDELEELKQKRMSELQQQTDDSAQQEAEMQQQIQELENVVKQRFTKEALERYGNLKTAHAEKALQVLVVIGQMLQAGQLTIIDDDTLKDVLRKLAPPKKDFRITRK